MITYDAAEWHNMPESAARGRRSAYMPCVIWPYADYKTMPLGVERRYHTEEAYFEAAAYNMCFTSYKRRRAAMPAARRRHNVAP